ARQWLASARPLSTEDASFRLMGLVWAEASAEEIAAARRDLLALRIRNSGWPQLPGYVADADSNGEGFYALTEAGGPVVPEPITFLVLTQARDGSWHVPTRMLSPANVSPKYFDTGFPYKKDEFLSYAGSCWALMALLRVLPESHRLKPVPPPPPHSP